MSQFATFIFCHSNSVLIKKLSHRARGCESCEFFELFSKTFMFPAAAASAAAAVQNSSPTRDIWPYLGLTCPALRLSNTRRVLCSLPHVPAAGMQRPPYSSLTLPQLKTEMARRGLVIPTPARKASLVQALDAHDASRQAAASSTQTLNAHGPAHSASSAVSSAHAARETPDAALEIDTSAFEALLDVRRALVAFGKEFTSDSQAALQIVLKSEAFTTKGYPALKGRELEIVKHHIVRCC